jgi:hypothetical protein
MLYKLFLSLTKNIVALPRKERKKDSKHGLKFHYCRVDFMTEVIDTQLCFSLK